MVSLRRCGGSAGRGVVLPPAGLMVNGQVPAPLIRGFYGECRNHPTAPGWSGGRSRTRKQERENRQTARLRRVPPPAAASSAPERVPPSPQRGWKNSMIPAPVRSVPKTRTVGALRLPTSMRRACDRFNPLVRDVEIYRPGFVRGTGHLERQQAKAPDICRSFGRSSRSLRQDVSSGRRGCSRGLVPAVQSPPVVR